MQHKAQCKASHLLAIVQQDRINESNRLSPNDIQWVHKTDPLLHPSPTYQTSSVPRTCMRKRCIGKLLWDLSRAQQHEAKQVTATCPSRLHRTTRLSTSSAQASFDRN